MSRLLLVLGLVSLVSCTPKNSSFISLKEDAAVMNGTDVKETDAILSSIVSVYDVTHDYLCTGSLIAPNVVLTAAHCVTGIKQSDMRIVFGTNVDEWLNAREPDVKAEHVRTISDMKAHHGYDEESNSEAEQNDIALIKFKGELPAGYKPAAFLPDESLLKRGTIVTVAGYGDNSVDLEEINPKKYNPAKLAQGIEDGSLMCDANQRICYEVNREGSGLLRQAKAPIASVQETEVRLDESKAGTCSGDSGGPAYVEKDGVYYLFGITSRGSELCDAYGVYTNALAFKTWLNDTIKILR